MYSLQYAELFRVNAVFFFVFLSLSFVFVYLSYCPGRACVFATVGGVVVSNEQRKLLSHPVVILNTLDRILDVFVFVCVYSSVCVLVFMFAHLIFYTCVTTSGHLNTPDFRELLFIAYG